MDSQLNIAFYRFVSLGEELAGLRQRLRAQCIDLGLRGTIILSPEGINGFLSGPEPAIRRVERLLRELPGLESMEFKESVSAGPSFQRLKVKLKGEIIPLGDRSIRPVEHPAPRLTATELRRWYEEGREFVILDTRNDYEVSAGTFENAVTLDLKTFREFPKTLNALPGETKESWKGKPIVTFCTGGIRCEKAAPAMLRLGFTDVFQLDGGILRYFEETGGAHFLGKCFVFDEREALDAELRPRRVLDGKFRRSSK